MSSKELSNETKFAINELTKNFNDEDLQLFINEVVNVRSRRWWKKYIRGEKC